VTAAFEDGARRALGRARQQAQALKHNFVGTEHLLLGLITGTGPAAGALAHVGLSADGVHADVVRIVGPGEEAVSDPAFTPNAEKVLAAAQREARSHGDAAIGSEHLLLGLVDVRGSVAARILDESGISAEDVREAALARLAARHDDAAEIELRPLSARSERALRQAHEAAVRDGSDEIEPRHLRAGLDALD
jgi:ATP-dependent Clp protease ATP-binding subunit ClpC